MEYLLLALKFSGLILVFLFVWASFYAACVDLELVKSNDAPWYHLFIFILSPLIFGLCLLFLIPSRILRIFR